MAVIQDLDDGMIDDIMQRLGSTISLVRFALSSKRYRSIASDQDFLCRFRQKLLCPTLIGLFFVPYEDRRDGTIFGPPCFCPVRTVPELRSVLLTGDFLLSRLQHDPLWLLRDCRNGRLLLSRNSALHIYNPTSGLHVEVPVQQIRRNYYQCISDCLLNDDLVMVLLDTKRKRMRACQYSFQNHEWYLHPWTGNISINHNDEECTTPMQAGGFIFWKSDSQSALTLDTARMMFSLVNLPATTPRRYYCIGESADGVGCFLNIRQEESHRGQVLQVWTLQVVGGCITWEFEREVSIRDRLGRRSVQKILAVAPGIALLHFETKIYIVELNSLKIRYEFYPLGRPYPFQMTWPPTALSLTRAGVPADSAKNFNKEIESSAYGIGLPEVLDNLQTCHALTLPKAVDQTMKIVRLLYTNDGLGLIALGSNGRLRLWKWSGGEMGPGGATASTMPRSWQASVGLELRDNSRSDLEEAVQCIALSRNNPHLTSTCGGKIVLFDITALKVTKTLLLSPPLPSSTCLSFCPQDDDIVVVGMEDSTIHIYNIRMHEVEHVLVGHHKRVTGLAFSSYHEILVSSGADGQVFIWAADPWGVKRGSFSIEIPAGKIPTGDTNVQFNYEQNHLLVVQECQMALYDAPKMERICQWVPNNALSAPISHATYSCNGQLVITSFTDGNLGIFNAENLHLRCRISPSAYLASSSISSNPPVYAPVVAAHPLEPNQFAIGLSDGSVKVIEPLGSEGKWGTPAPVDNSVPKGKKVRVRKCKRGRTG